MSRQNALHQLKQLSPAQFEEVVFQLGMPRDLLRREVALRQQILDLIQYAEQQEHGLETLLTIIAEVSPPKLPKPQKRKKLAPRWLALSALAALLAGAIWLFYIEQPTATQVLAGSVRDATGQPLPGVSVAVPAYGDVSTTTDTTDAFGRFRLLVKAPPQAEVTLLAQKDAYQPYEQYATLGNTGLSFMMHRQPQEK